MQVAVFVFDLLLFDGESMVSKTLRQRRDRLALALPVRRTSSPANGSSHILPEKRANALVESLVPNGRS